MPQLKHVARVKNTGRRCVVVFREMYDDKGNVIDENTCLAFESDNLPDAEHQNLMSIVEGSAAQTTGDLFNVLARERLGNGMTALAWLDRTKRLRKFPTNNIELVPDNNNVIQLDTLNKIVKMQKSGMSAEDIQKSLDSGATSATEVSDASQTTATEDGVLDDTALAASLVQQAETFEQQAKELREQAVELDPSLAPKKRTRKQPPKKA